MNTRYSDFIQEYQVERDCSKKKITYNGLFIRPKAKKSEHCVLVLTGTSVQLQDIQLFIDSLVNKGYAVAAIDRNIGNILNIEIHPKLDRLLALKHFLSHLTEKFGVDKINIVTQSYASFETVRTLINDPETYAKKISNIIMVNPAGFNNRIKYIPHCLRFLFIHMLSEYIKTLRYFIMYKLKISSETKHYARKMRALNSFLIKTLQNPTRTFREIADITSFDIRPYVELLLKKYGYPFYFVLNRDDNLVAMKNTLSWSQIAVPNSNILVFSGNHLDSFIDERQILLILELIDKIHSRKYNA